MAILYRASLSMMKQVSANSTKELVDRIALYGSTVTSETFDLRRITQNSSLKLFIAVTLLRSPHPQVNISTVVGMDCLNNLPEQFKTLRTRFIVKH